MNDTTEEKSVGEGRDQTRSDRPRTGAWAMALPIGLLSAAAGFLPWWATGARLPLQDLWDGAARQGDMPITLLPFSQYFVILVFAMIVVGAAVAGIGGRVLRVGGWGVVLITAGVLLVQVTATAQTALVVRDGLQQRLESTIYLSGLVVGTCLSILVGIVVTVLIARAPRAGALVGLTIGAIAAASWTGALLVPIGAGAAPLTDALVIIPWIAPVLTGIAIAWTGIDTAGRVLAALLAVALIWIAPALTTAVASALGSRALIRSGSDVVDYGIGVFQLALLTPEVALRPIIATVVVAAVGLGIRMIARRRRHGHSHR